MDVGCDADESFACHTVVGLENFLYICAVKINSRCKGKHNVYIIQTKRRLFYLQYAIFNIL